MLKMDKNCTHVQAGTGSSIHKIDGKYMYEVNRGNLRGVFKQYLGFNHFVIS